MSRIHDLPLTRLQFQVTTEYPCGYLEGQLARSLVAVPMQVIDTAIYGELVRLGFRRSGRYVYRPHCAACQACVPVRLNVADFQPTRSQRRAWRQHHQLTAIEMAPAFAAEQFELYAHYQKSRHVDGGMDHDDPGQYRSFLMQSDVHTRLVEYRAGDALKMVSVMDQLADGLSAVYTFYDPEPQASYGTYAVLWQVERCRALGLPYLYLGYWIRDSRKMAYKSNFQPLERYVDGAWKPF